MRDISAGGTSVNRSAIMRVSRPDIFHGSKIKPRGWLLCGGEVAVRDDINSKAVLETLGKEGRKGECIGSREII